MTPEKKSTVRNKRKNRMQSTQRYLQFAGVHDDTLILKNGGLRSVVRVGAINVHLKSEEEQEGIIRSYQQFLNTLDFPVQILVQSRKLDIDPYMTSLKTRRKAIENELLRDQMDEYIGYVSRLIEYADIMEKHFFIVVPVDPPRAQKKSVFASFLSYISPDDTVVELLKRRGEFVTLRKELDSRQNVVLTSLESMGLSANPMDTAQIIELFYETYNPENARLQKFSHVEDFALDPDETSPTLAS